MKESVDADWSQWQEQIRDYLRKQGFLPTPTQAGLEVPFDLVSDSWMAADLEPQKLRSLCRLSEAVGDAVERASVVMFLWYLTNDQPYLRLPEDEEADRRGRISALFREALLALPAEELRETWRIRWELLFAASAGEWKRVGELVRRWMELDPASERDALRAVIRINFLSVYPIREIHMAPDWWGAYEGANYSGVGELFATIYALQLDDRSP